jgi:SnoaL-like polyketide cyclase
MVQNNLELMKTLDDAWNGQEWTTFRKRHAKDTAVYWPGQAKPTLGHDAHQAESEAFLKSIENSLENNPYKVMFASGAWTCTIAKWKGRMIGPLTGPDDGVHPPTNKTFELEFCPVARWKNGEIVEERLFYDQVGFLSVRIRSIVALHRPQNVTRLGSSVVLVPCRRSPRDRSRG